MSTKHTQDKWINKRRFMLDWDSTDEDDSNESHHFPLRTFRKNSLNVVERKKTPIIRELDDEQYLSDILSLPRKQFHSDHDVAHKHHQSRYRSRPFHKKNSWMIHENGRIKDFTRFKYEEKDIEEPCVDENSAFEGHVGACLDRFKPIEFNIESLSRLDDYLDFKVLVTDFWKEENVDDCNYVTNAKPYLQDSGEELNMAAVTNMCHNAGYDGSNYNMLTNLI